MTAFDELARSLATPMPRGRALRLAAGVILAAAVPGMRAGRAFATAAPGRCDDPDIPANCGRIYPDQPQGNDWCCEKQADCWRGPTGQGGRCCPPADRCGSQCCDPDDKCKDGSCIYCPDERVCGKTCCGPREFCGSKLRSLCCPTGHNVCVVPNKRLATCCDKSKGEECCFTKTAVDCCKTSAGQKCRNGRCVCPDGKPSCGGECCAKGKYCSKDVCCKTGRENCGDGYCCGAKKGQSCSKGKCCGGNKVNCGDNRCCEKDDCCEKMCCDGKSRICAGGVCCPGERLVGSGKNARCCPPGTVTSVGGTCCPESNPECCSDGDLALVCAKGFTCVRGVCKKL